MASQSFYSQSAYSESPEVEVEVDSRDPEVESRDPEVEGESRDLEGESRDSEGYTGDQESGPSSGPKKPKVRGESTVPVEAK